jgi:HPt (histidine-containing phosphotransfer) domain-containing protein
VPEAIDWAELRGRLMGDDRLVRRILAAFPDDLDNILASIRDARDAGDLPAAARAAHTLKGAAANLGAAPLRAACDALEKAAVAADAPAVANHATEVFAAAETLRTAIRSGPP